VTVFVTSSLFSEKMNSLTSSPCDEFTVSPAYLLDLSYIMCNLSYAYFRAAARACKIVTAFV